MRTKYKTGKPGDVQVGDNVAHIVNPWKGYNTERVNGLELNRNCAGRVWNTRVREVKDGLAQFGWGPGIPIEELVTYEEIA